MKLFLLTLLLSSTFYTTDYIKDIDISQVDNQIQLSWMIDINKDLVSIRIERGIETDKFEVIGKIKLETTTSTYNFLDQSPYLGKSYYRFVVIDKRGKKTYSKIVNIELKNNYELHIPHSTDWSSYGCTY